MDGDAGDGHARLVLTLFPVHGNLGGPAALVVIFEQAVRESAIRTSLLLWRLRSLSRAACSKMLQREALCPRPLPFYGLCVLAPLRYSFSIMALAKQIPDL